MVTYNVLFFQLMYFGYIYLFIEGRIIQVDVDVLELQHDDENDNRDMSKATC